MITELVGAYKLTNIPLIVDNSLQRILHKTHQFYIHDAIYVSHIFEFNITKFDSLEITRKSKTIKKVRVSC